MEAEKLRWLCRRGTKELDVIVSRYLDHHYANASAEEKLAFQTLLQLEDPLLYDLILGNQLTETSSQQVVIDQMVTG